MELPRRLAVLVCVLAPALAPGVVRAEGKRGLVVEVSPARDWRAGALRETLTADLADDRLVTRVAPRCDGPCSDAALRGAGVELVMRATLAGADRVDYELRALWPGAPAPVRGAIVLGGLDRVGFAGLLRDQLHRLARATREDSAPDAEIAPVAGAVAVAVHPSASGLPSPDEIAVALAVALGVLATPILFGFVRTRRILARGAARRTALGVVSLGAAALAMSMIAPANGHGVLLAAGGIAWGAFAAVTIPVAFPPLVGLGRIAYRELGRLLAAWSVLVVQRVVVIAVVYAPIALAVALVPDGVGGELFSGATRIALVVPLALLIARQWLRLALAVAADRLDAALVGSPASAADAVAWHDAVRGYFVGYLRRNGLPIDLDLLDRMTVLPIADLTAPEAAPDRSGSADEILVYGGGATHTRIAIPQRMLERALAPWGRPHDYAAPRVSTLHWTQWNAGLVMATEAGAAIASRDQRQPRDTTAEGDPSETAREHFGEPPTLVGIVEPAALDPRTSYRPHDDPAWLDWDAGDDYDGTDAGDRDFLFGALVHAVAQIERHGDRQSTLALVLRRAGRFTAPLGRLLDRSPDAVGDGHAAIKGARHHLVQYLGWQAWQREDLLTARADAPELEAMSRRVLAELGSTSAPASAPAARPSPSAARARARLARLAGFVDDAPQRSGWRRLAVAAAVVAGAGVIALEVVDAVRYHAVYTDRSRPDPTEKPDHGKT